MSAEKNPYRATTFDSSAHDSGCRRSPISRRNIALWSVAYFYPLLATACFYSSWLVAWISLGHMPRPMLDDPKSIGVVVDLVYMLSMLAIVSLPVLTPLCFFASFYCPLRLARRRSAQAIALAVAYIIASAGLFLLLRFDPGRVVEWWFD